MCPFCGAVSVAVTKPRARMSRASLIGAAAVALACGSSTPQDDAGAQDSGTDSFQGAYGGPPIDASTKDSPNEGSIAAYGGPPIDAGGG